jgi:chromate transporter
LPAVITGVIFFAAVDFAIKNGIILPDMFEKSGHLIKGGWNIAISKVNLFEIKSIIIAAAAFLLLVKTKVHPILIILGSAIVGILLF